MNEVLIDRTNDCKMLWFTTDVERLARALRKILTNPVEDHDRIVHREADDGQHGSHEWRVHLDVQQLAQDREDAEHHQHVVQHRDHRSGAEADWVRRVAESKTDVEEDRERGSRDGDDRLLGQLRRDRSADDGALHDAG